MGGRCGDDWTPQAISGSTEEPMKAIERKGQKLGSLSPSYQQTIVVDVSNRPQASARGDETVVGLHPRQLADATDGHGESGGGLRQPARLAKVSDVLLLGRVRSSQMPMEE